MSGDSDYPETRRVSYVDGAQFVPVCEICGRYVKADESITVDGGGNLVDIPNADCKKCGRTFMLFEGFMLEDWL